MHVVHRSSVQTDDAARQPRGRPCQQAACCTACRLEAAAVGKRLDVRATSSACCELCTAVARIQQTAAGAQLLASATVDVVLLIDSEHARTAPARCARVPHLASKRAGVLIPDATCCQQPTPSSTGLSAAEAPGKSRSEVLPRHATPCKTADPLLSASCARLVGRRLAAMGPEPPRPPAGRTGARRRRRREADGGGGAVPPRCARFCAPPAALGSPRRRGPLVLSLWRAALAALLLLCCARGVGGELPGAGASRRQLAAAVAYPGAPPPLGTACGGVAHRWAWGSAATALAASNATLRDVGAAAAGAATPSWAPSGAWNATWGGGGLAANGTFVSGQGNLVRGRSAARQSRNRRKRATPKRARSFLPLLTRTPPYLPL